MVIYSKSRLQKWICTLGLEPKAKSFPNKKIKSSLNLGFEAGAWNHVPSLKKEVCLGCFSYP